LDIHGTKNDEPVALLHIMGDNTERDLACCAKTPNDANAMLEECSTVQTAMDMFLNLLQ
jgi:hypothetical protein